MDVMFNGNPLQLVAGVVMMFRYQVMLCEPTVLQVFLVSNYLVWPVFWWVGVTVYTISFTTYTFCHVCEKCQHRSLMVRCKETGRVYCTNACAKRDKEGRRAARRAARGE